ncbi:MAG TPA: PfkB family carbohydrate kinase [Geminicoccaceae bacterium]
MSEASGFDVCVVGHVVLDRNVIDGVEHPPQPGGAAWYATVAYARLGLRAAVLTRVAAADEGLLLGGLWALGVTVVNLGAPRSTVFRNIDSTAPGARRAQRVDQQAPPIGPADLRRLEALVWHLGPLRHDDLDDGLAAACLGRGGRVALDVQGLIRRVEGGRVEPRPPRASGDLGAIHVLKADEAEILTFTGAGEVDDGARAALRAGAGEVVITKADRGSILFEGDRRIPIPAYRPAVEVDPTGCGDTYLAGYLARRLETADLEECGRFAAAVAALKLEAVGPFRGDRERVAALRRAARA